MPERSGGVVITGKFTNDGRGSISTTGPSDGTGNNDNSVPPQTPPPPPPPGDPSEPDDPGKRGQLIENERWKYLATFINTVAAASIAVGILTPFSALLAKGPAALADFDATAYAGLFIFWLFTAGALHCGVQIVLGNLRP